MTSNRTDTNERDDAFLNDLIQAHNVEVPALSFRRRAPKPAGGGFFSRHWRPSLLAAAVAGVALFLGASSGLPGNETPSVSAQEILQKANATSAQSAAPSQPYHLIAETVVAFEQGREVANAPAGVSLKQPSYMTETWYRGPEQYRTEQRDGSAPGKEIEHGQVRNGNDVWLFNRASGGLKVAHGSASVLDIAVSKEVLPDANSLADLLAVYNQPCMKAVLEGDKIVLGREAYVILVEFDASSCPKKPGEADDDRGRKDSNRITIDKDLFLPLMSERIDANGHVPYRYTVIQLDIGKPIDASVFAYQPPAGATVTEVGSAMEAKMSLSDQMPSEQVEKLIKEGCTVALGPSSKEPEGVAKAVECPANAAKP